MFFSIVANSWIFIRLNCIEDLVSKLNSIVELMEILWKLGLENTKKTKLSFL